MNVGRGSSCNLASFSVQDDRGPAAVVHRGGLYLAGTGGYRHAVARSRSNPGLQTDPRGPVRGPAARRLGAVQGDVDGRPERRHLRITTACLAAVLVGGAARSGDAPTSPSVRKPVAAEPGAPAAFLLIDAAMLEGEPRLVGCDHAMSDLHARLDRAGVSNAVLTAPTTSAIREGLLRFAADRNGTGHVLLFCGYAADQDGNLFALGSDGATHDDLSMSAVSVRAFSRVLDSAGGTALLDLHPTAGAPAEALAGVARAWVQDDSLLGHKLARVEREPDEAMLVAGLAGSRAVSVEAIAAGTMLPPASPPPAAAVLTAPPPPAAKPAPPVASPPVPATAPPSPPPPAPAVWAVVPNPTHPAATARLTPPARKPRPRPAERRPALVANQTEQRIQLALLARGLYLGRVSGYDDAATQASVRHFQAIIGHPLTGQVTPAELRLLMGG